MPQFNQYPNVSLPKKALPLVGAQYCLSFSVREDKINYLPNNT